LVDIFADAEVQRAIAQGDEIPLGRGRSLLLPRILGFCGGVDRALTGLSQVLASAGNRQVWLLGEIIHNDTVNRHFLAQGVKLLEPDELGQLFEVAQPHDFFVIPAFGIPKRLDHRLREFCTPPGKIMDAACGYVRQIWTFILRMQAEERTIVIHGKPNHPETKATISRALGECNAVIVVADMAEAHHLAGCVRAGDLSGFPAKRIMGAEHLTLGSMALVNQTTMLYRETKAIEEELRAAVLLQGGELWAPETVCRATQERQDAARELCRQGCDLILVVGGFASSNTNQLYRLAVGHAPTYFTADAQAIGAQSIQHFLPVEQRQVESADWLPKNTRRIGLLAGASCPPSDIGGIIGVLRRLSADDLCEVRG